MYSHRLIERAQATARFSNQHNAWQQVNVHVWARMERLFCPFYPELCVDLSRQNGEQNNDNGGTKGASSHHRNAAVCHFYRKQGGAAGAEVPPGAAVLWVQSEDRKRSPPQAVLSPPPPRAKARNAVGSQLP